MARIVDGTEMNMIGDKLRALRTANGWSQQAVSDKLEMLAIYVCRGSISRIEDKQRTVTDIELYGLSQVFHVPVILLSRITKQPQTCQRRASGCFLLQPAKFAQPSGRAIRESEAARVYAAPARPAALADLQKSWCVAEDCPMRACTTLYASAPQARQKWSYSKILLD